MKTKHDKEYYVISDLHLAEGSSRGPYYLGTENFEVDQQFSDFLDYLQSKNLEEKELIINGDFVDFIRITSVPQSEEDFDNWEKEIHVIFPHRQVSEIDIDCTEKKYGLKTNRYKSIWKLFLAIHGHSIFFEALKKWIQNDNVLVITEGNHDPEWYWPEVRDYFCFKLTGQKTSDKIIFKTEYDRGEASYCPVENVRIEHGHLVDEMNTTEKDRVLDQNKEELMLPRGSFFNRYIVNSAELAFPFLDNLDPKDRYVLNILKNNPVGFISFAFNHVPYLWKMLQKFKAVYVSKILNTIIIIELAVILFLFLVKAEFFGWLGNSFVASLLSLGVFNINSVVNTIKTLFGFKVTSFQEDVIDKAKSLKVKNIIVGHNHNPEVIQSGERTYYNTGSWTRSYNLSPSKVKNGHLLTFVRFTNESDISLRIWDTSLHRDIQYFFYKKDRF